MYGNDSIRNRKFFIAVHNEKEVNKNPPLAEWINDETSKRYTKHPETHHRNPGAYSYPNSTSVTSITQKPTSNA